MRAQEAIEALKSRQPGEIQQLQMKQEPTAWSEDECSPLVASTKALAVSTATTATTTTMKRRQPPPNKKTKKTKKKRKRQQQQQQQESQQEIESLRSRVSTLEQFVQLQAARNDVNTNMFVLLLNELSLKLNMKGRQREVKDPKSYILDSEVLCQLKNSVEHDAEEGKQTVKRVALRVLEAASISLSGQTVTSRDDKTLHRLRQIQAFKQEHNVPINGMVAFKKNVTRLNQDAGLACDMTLSTVTDQGRNVCFGSPQELAEVNGHLKALNDTLDNIDIDTDINLSDFCVKKEEEEQQQQQQHDVAETTTPPHEGPGETMEEEMGVVELMDL